MRIKQSRPYLSYYLGLIKSVQSKEWQPEEKYEVQGDQQSGATHAPSKSRENQVKEKKK